MEVAPEALFAALAHPLRLRALLLLREAGELCVCELTGALEVAQPVLSRHLALLREAGIVADRREGRWVHYRLHEGLPAWARCVLDCAAEGVAGQARPRRDRERLTIARRPGVRCRA